ncbi:hypothetical protein BW721_08845 [Jeotgalibaca sp. PTS2502]|uniref:Helix-turn-helix domain-containing protein n=1 Tax=Candidatus Jeotgalibaca merdavium TaxID=2838627 RepID=A0A9D2HY68_9LACT|nr:helix-turn-helix transcriptional regulator [Jeotgalibaca sp. PTS2502]APZ49733.1 hypothetical protein BW721_08845 [Jeotgalibaca sp. PTS2502]HJA89540.1 helix-turn-helix domain-containing protein [Candidatus Jeotgalibaca merdavium]HJB24806.1 helix-turn-helix domain-containing protein [Candidatus Jeotgalibaca pullicola]
MKIGERLKQGRENLNMTQQQVADIINVSRPTISNWENERSYPDLESIVILSDLYNQSLDELLREDYNVVETITNETKKSKQRKNLILVLLLIFIPLTSYLGYKNWLDLQSVNMRNVNNISMILNGDRLNQDSLALIDIDLDNHFKYSGYYVDTTPEKDVINIQLYQQFTLNKNPETNHIQIEVALPNIDMAKVNEIRLINQTGTEIKTIFVRH